MKISILSLPIVVFLTCQGCTHEAWYEGFRQGRITECYKLSGSEKDQCLQETAVSYDTYKKERRKTLE
jgi:hypothetical protein